MQVEAIAEHDLTADQDAEIAQLIGRAFGVDHGYQGRSFYKQRHHLRLLARMDGQLIGHYALGFREIRMGNQLIQIIGLAEVATDPNFQGKGVASTLMAATIERARPSLADFLVLFGTRPLYEGVGFVAKRNLVRRVGIAAGRTTKIILQVETALKVLQLKDTKWDDDAEIDLLGPDF